MNPELTFRQIEDMLGVPVDTREPQSALELWYDSVRNRRIVDLSDEDICRACRQSLYPEYIVPVALQRLSQDPLTGEHYDGELLVAMNSIPLDYWKKYSIQAIELKALLLPIKNAVDHLASNLLELSGRLNCIEDPQGGLKT